MNSHAVAQFLRGDSVEGASLPLFIFGQTEDVLAWIDDHTFDNTLCLVDWSFNSLGESIAKALTYLHAHRRETRSNTGSIRFIKYW